ncbi:hypothetical protein E5288_WYG022343 [Bos mutus]|uniref:Uncharacterized protein n=1 Tax=Bos mutus TaxID=72004 RepID=A0A6B0S050_9CETA|nr:hypothetical protein [Bos mutus]
MRSVGPAVPTSPAFCRPPPSPACSEKPLAAAHSQGPSQHRNPKLTQNDCVHLVLRPALRPQTLTGNGEG